MAMDIHHDCLCGLDAGSKVAGISGGALPCFCFVVERGATCDMTLFFLLLYE